MGGGQTKEKEKIPKVVRIVIERYKLATRKAKKLTKELGLRKKSGRTL